MYRAHATPIPEGERRRIVQLVLCAFWLLVFEGSLRKWVAPQFSAYLYFIRDPLTLYIYFLALRAGVFRNQSVLLHAGMAMAALAAMLAVVHVAMGGGQYTPLLAAYGLRNYFFYIPFAFVVGNCFRFQDVCALGRHCLVAILIAAPIAVLQFNAPANSPLNVGIAADSRLQFDNLVSGGGKVRPAGTFTSAVGMTQLIVACVAFLLYAWTTSRRPPPLNPWLVRVGIVATAAALGVSGSRTSFVHACLVIVAAMMVAPLLPGAGAKWRTLVIPVIATVAFAVLFPLLLPEAFSAFASRWDAAAATEGQRFALGWVGRALHGLTDFLRLMGDMPVFGFGVGMAGNAASSAGVQHGGLNILRVAEEDWSRHVVELGPVLALLFIGYRTTFGVRLGLDAWRAALRTGQSLPLLLWVFAAVSLIQGQITGHGLVNGFGWLFVGLCMAASRDAVPADGLAQDRANSDPSGARSLAATPFPNLMR